MSCNVKIAVLLAFGAIALGGIARAADKNSDTDQKRSREIQTTKSFNFKKLAEKLSHDKSSGDSKWHMGGSLTGPKGTPENPYGNNDSSKWHMGGSTTGPKGTPENPYCKDGCHDKCHDGCHDPKFPVIDPGKGH